MNHISTHRTFILFFLPLKILKLLPTNYRPGQREHSKHSIFGKVNLFLKVNIFRQRNTSVQQMKRKSISSPPKHRESYSYFKFVDFQKFIMERGPKGSSPGPQPCSISARSNSIGTSGIFSFVFFFTPYFNWYYSAILSS